MSDFVYRHIIWDWNGTLLDDAGLCVEIMNEVLESRGLPLLTLDRYQAIFDFPVRDYYRAIGFDFAVDSFERLSDEFMDAYTRRVWDCDLRTGGRAALQQAQKRGISQSILSAMQQETLDRMVDHFGLRDYFTAVVGISNHHAAGKQHTARQWIAAQTLPAADMLMIGDTTHDHEVAESLGVACALIHSGHHSRERLAATGARVLDSLAAVVG